MDRNSRSKHPNTRNVLHIQVEKEDAVPESDDVATKIPNLTNLLLPRTVNSQDNTPMTITSALDILRKNPKGKTGMQSPINFEGLCDEMDEEVLGEFEGICATEDWMRDFVVVAYDYHQSGGANSTLDEKRVLSKRNMLDGDRSILDITSAFKGRLTSTTGCWSTYIAAFLAETKLNRRNAKFYEQGEDATTLLVSMENSEGGDESALPKSLKTGAQVAIAFLRELKDSKAQERMVLTLTKMFGEDAAVLISGLISRVNLPPRLMSE
jgi:hypothetical protein